VGVMLCEGLWSVGIERARSLGEGCLVRFGCIIGQDDD